MERIQVLRRTAQVLALVLAGTFLFLSLVGTPGESVSESGIRRTEFVAERYYLLPAFGAIVLLASLFTYTMITAWIGAAALGLVAIENAPLRPVWVVSGWLTVLAPIALIIVLGVLDLEMRRQSKAKA